MKLTIALRAAAVALVFAVSGCATRSMTVLRHDLSTRTVCCASFAEMKFAPLTTDESDVSLGSGSPIFAFDEGKSYFAAFSLPSGKVPGVVFRTYLTTEFLPDTSVFVPAFVFLDASKHSLSVVREVPMRRDATNFWLGESFSGVVAVPDGAAFVVVFTVDAPHQELTAISENGTRWPVPGALSGKLKLALSR